MRLLSLALILMPFSSALGGGDGVPGGYFDGRYTLIGRGIDSSHTYTGKVDIYHSNDHLRFRRTVGDIVIEGHAAIESVLGGDSRVLRFRYAESGKQLEETCLWQSDLDNYPRISCYLYEPGIDTKDPGLEVLFPDRTSE